LSPYSCAKTQDKLILVRRKHLAPNSQLKAFAWGRRCEVGFFDRVLTAAFLPVLSTAVLVILGFAPLADRPAGLFFFGARWVVRDGLVKDFSVLAAILPSANPIFCAVVMRRPPAGRFGLSATSFDCRGWGCLSLERLLARFIAAFLMGWRGITFPPRLLYGVLAEPDGQY